MIQVGLISRIAIFAALIYVLSWGTVFLPNVNLIFFVVFTAGLIWGIVPGVLVGGIGMGLWTTFHPYGPAMPPIMIAQVIGASAGGVVGGLYARTNWPDLSPIRRTIELVLLASACTILCYLPVTFIDAWLFQPFWPRFISGLAWVGISLASNVLIFPLLFPVTRRLYQMERKRR